MTRSTNQYSSCTCSQSKGEFGNHGMRKGEGREREPRFFRSFSFIEHAREKKNNKENRLFVC